MYLPTRNEIKFKNYVRNLLYETNNSIALVLLYNDYSGNDTSFYTCAVRLDHIYCGIVCLKKFQGPAFVL